MHRAGEVLFTLAKAFPQGKYIGYDISSKALTMASKRLAKTRHILTGTFLHLA